MRSVSIPGTDIKPSAICLGVADVGVKNTEREAHQLLDFFAAQGGTFIDTARVYSNWVPGELNRSERILGDWLKASGMRDRIVLATKGAHPDLKAMKVPRMSPAEVGADIDGSLRSLRVDRIDLYYLHRDDPSRPVEAIVDMLDTFVTQGKIRCYGCSNWRPPRVEAAVLYARRKGTSGFVANQMLWNLGCWTMSPLGDPTIAVFDRATHDLHRRLGIAAIPFSSQANGFFTKLHRLGGKPDERLRGTGYCSDVNVATYRLLAELAGKLGVTVTDLVLLYLLEQDIPTIPIVGCHTQDQLTQSMAAAGKHIDKATLKRIEATAHAA